MVFPRGLDRKVVFTFHFESEVKHRWQQPRVLERDLGLEKVVSMCPCVHPSYLWPHMNFETLGKRYLY